MRYQIISLSTIVILIISSFPISSASASSTFGATYYVDVNHPQAEDSGDHGSIDWPWKTIEYALGQLQAGDTLFIRGGVYSENVVHTRDGGTEQAPVIVRAYQGEEVVWRGGQDGYLWHIVSGQWWILEDIIFEDRLILGYSPSEIAEHITIRNCTFRDSNVGGIFSSYARHILIDGCYFVNLRSGQPGADLNAIDISGWGDDITIRNSRFEDIGSDGMHLGGQGDEIGQVVIENNEFFISGQRSPVGENGVEVEAVQGPIIISGNTFHGFRETVGGQDASGSYGEGLLIQGSERDVRAIWAWRYDWEGNTPELADQMLDRVVQGGFDTVLYYVGSGSVNYNSSLLPQSPDVAYDSLAYVVEQGHARGLKVEAWWCPGPAMVNSTLRSQHPEWDITAIDGIPADAHWFNFSLPEVRQFVSDVVLEIAENYDVDGVHLDYIRYEAPPPWGPFDPAAFFSPDDVPNTVRLCYERLKAVRPEVLLTAAVMSSQGSSEGHLQNWADWLAGEHIDRVMPMAYYDPDETYAKPDGSGTLERDLGQWQALPHFERIAPGLKVSYEDKTLKTPEQLIEQVEVCWEGGAKDITIFSEYSITVEQLGALQAIFLGGAAAKNVVVEKNLFYDNAIHLWVHQGSDNIVVRNNILRDAYGEEAHGIGMSVNEAMSVQVLHNTFFNNKLHLRHGDKVTTGVIKNNVFCQGGFLGIPSPGGLSDWDADYNAWSGILSGIPPSGAHDVLAADLGLDDDLKPTGSSPLIDAGADVGVIEDFAGNVRSDENPDIGAHEYTGGNDMADIVPEFEGSVLDMLDALEAQVTPSKEKVVAAMAALQAAQAEFDAVLAKIADIKAMLAG